MKWYWAATLAALAVATAAPAADLARVRADAKLAREPAYRGVPRYCLLAFGPECKARVWLALDGDTLYADTNGDGDLTQPGERFAPKKPDSLTYNIGEVRDGDAVHKGLTVYISDLTNAAADDKATRDHLARHPGAKGCSVGVDVSVPGLGGSGVGGRVEFYSAVHDAEGYLLLAAKPADAPVVHLGGPLQMIAERPQPWTAGRPVDLTTTIGTKGLGAGTTANIAYEKLIPDDKHPVAQITFPPVKAGEPPTRERYELKQRC